MTIVAQPELENQQDSTQAKEKNSAKRASPKRLAEFDSKAPNTPSNSDFKCGNFTVTKDGLYYSETNSKDENDGETNKESTNNIESVQTWICSPIWPEAYLRNQEGRDHSLLLKLKDGEREHFWALPKRLIIKINDINEVLLDYGQQVPLIPRNQKLLQQFLMTALPDKKMRCVDKAGWHGTQYVFPDGKVIGNSQAGEGVYPLNDICPRGVSIKGTLQEWQDAILSLCIGNSRLIFGIGTAFASLCLIDDDGGGFNFKGKSSIGKTKCLRVATSVIGSREYQRSWKTTSNGLEGVCALHNDSLLPLDEFGLQDAAEAGEISYMISSGIGKQRASRDGSARDPRTWRVLVLSTGETGLEGHMNEGRKKVRVGQLTRIIDIPADAGKELGCFENVHNLTNGQIFADELETLCDQYYGTPGRAFVEKIVEYGVEKARKEIRFAIDDFIAENANDYDGQVKRVARRFGLVYGALILSTKFGITPELNPKESNQAVVTCFKAWLDDRGTGGSLESHALIEQVTGSLNENAESKFVNKNDAFDEKRIRNALWGYRDGAKFFLFPKAFKEICEGFEDAAKTLKAEGLLIPDANGGRNAQSLRVSAHFKDRDRFYVIDLGVKDKECINA